MRRHHEETHVVDDLLRAQQPAIVGRRLAKLGEQVFAVAVAPGFDLAAEERDHEPAALHAARHQRAGQRRANDGDRRGDHVDERALERLLSAPSSRPKNEVAARSSVSCLIAG